MTDAKKDPIPPNAGDLCRTFLSCSKSCADLEAESRALDLRVQAARRRVTEARLALGVLQPTEGTRSFDLGKEFVVVSRTKDGTIVAGYGPNATPEPV